MLEDRPTIPHILLGLGVEVARQPYIRDPIIGATLLGLANMELGVVENIQAIEVGAGLGFMVAAREPLLKAAGVVVEAGNYIKDHTTEAASILASSTTFALTQLYTETTLPESLLAAGSVAALIESSRINGGFLRTTTQVGIITAAALLEGVDPVVVACTAAMIETLIIATTVTEGIGGLIDKVKKK